MLHYLGKVEILSNSFFGAVEDWLQEISERDSAPSIISLNMRFEKTTGVPVAREELYAWHMRRGAFERLTPPWQDIRIVERRGRPDEEGSRVELSVPLGPWRTRWIAEHTDVVPGHMFRDVQARGPFQSWEHTHRFLDNGSESTLVDEVTYELPFGSLGRTLADRRVSLDLERVFRYRHRITAGDLEAHARYADRPRMRILVTGASGLLGTALQSFLSTGGHEVIALSRAIRSRAGVRHWDPESGSIDISVFEGIDAVVHLAGESIASRRWTQHQKRRILESRVRGTKLLCDTIARLRDKPRVLVSASAIGIYGDRGIEALDEYSSVDPEESFLSNVCREWERATEGVQDDVRIVQLRTGIVLSPRGGALARMLLPFRFGVGGKVGSGKQFMSWISIDEYVAVVLHSLMTESLHGPVNAVSPTPVSNREFTAALGRTLRRPALLPLPGVVARAALGELARELLLASARVVPRKLVESQYKFQYPELAPVLDHLLGAESSSLS
jgi:uncharacterized protein (TIGR01777 family)